jgi:NAD(P)-dependent dehydrogenase (short-subunit alcohol dehydrogenase family)
MDKKIAIITGANGGLGKVHTKTLVNAGYEVIMACRNIPKSTQIYESIKAETGGSIELFELNLASFTSIKNFAELIKSRYTEIDILLNNAGLLCHKSEVTEENFEMTVGVNYLGHYFLTYLLLPLMREKSRIVNMVSLTYKYGKISANIFNPLSNKEFRRFETYSNSKLALLYFTLDLAEELKGRGISVNCADPGIVSTNIIRMGINVIDYLCDRFFRPLIKTPEKGADTMLYLALSDEIKGKTGLYYVNRKNKKISESIINHPQRKILREQTEEIIRNYI